MFPTESQFSAGGVAYRQHASQIEVALIAVGPQRRWQLPKGTIESGESPESTALREVQEEAGLETEIVELLDVIEYWYVGNHRGRRVRFHKKVHFFLMKYQSGDVANHDHEVEDAQWMEISDAVHRLAFKNEKLVVEKAQARIAELADR